MGDARVAQGVGRVTLRVEPYASQRLLSNTRHRAHGEVPAPVAVGGGREKGVGGRGPFFPQSGG